ncbi:MAG TPA: MFS transporter [Dehalococcoidia bacterium]|nr:MFS transporter [Dehalococcoidia bacterium]
MARTTVEAAQTVAALAGEVIDAPQRSWAQTTFDAFQFPVYRTLWLGSFFAFLSFNMAGTAQAVVAFDLTGSNRAVGTVMFGQGISMLLLNPFGGAIADRFSKRWLILVAQLVIGGVMLAFAILITTGHIRILFLAAGTFITGTMFSFLGPTRTALLGDTVSPNRIGNAMALMQVANNFGRIAGPFCAGPALALIGSAGTYYLIASIFILVLITLSKLPDPPRVTRAGASVLEDVRGAIRYVVSRKRLLHAVLSFHLVMVIGFSNIVVMPGFAKDVLHSGNTGLGLLLGVSAAGGFVMSVIVASLADSRRAPLYLTICSFSAGVALIVVGFAPTLALAALTMIFVSGGISGFQTLNNAFALRLTEISYYGRVVGLIFMAWGMINLMSLPVGFFADAYGERTVLTGSGILLCITVLLLALTRPPAEDDLPNVVQSTA